MTRRIAASMSLVAFFVCIVTGMQASNSFTTIVYKALVAMVVTFVVGLILGMMAQKMLDEEIKAPDVARNLENASIQQPKTETSGR